MSGGEDAFSAFDTTLAGARATDPWRQEPGTPAVYAPDFPLLERLLAIPVAAGAKVVSGRFARAIDAWLAHELRRCGFGPDEVWPRATRPRVLPRELAMLLDRLPAKLADEVRSRLPALPALAPTDARVLGRAYDKQVDVCVARWDRGPELLVSTKAQLSSFGKNLPNRFEEAYGDAGNLRARYPLASVGFLFVQRATVRTEEPDAYERTVDMVRKLRDIGAGYGYTATGLLLVDWEDPAGDGTEVRVCPEGVPEDVAAPQFLTGLIDQVLAVTPVQYHVEVRRRRERRPIPIPDGDGSGLF
ncbi:MAG TPA: hypothetical protein VFP72_00525 [Kineosporiaceae bacterium]|nr:hypothetical protein [Kineosporiaceae bacterium]